VENNIKQIVNAIINNNAVLHDRMKLKSLLLDFFAGDKLHVNLLVLGFDINIIDIINSTEDLDQFVYSKAVKQLINEYGVSKNNANWCINYWFELYGIEICKKDRTYNIDDSFTCEDSNDKEKEERVYQYYHENQDALDLSLIDEGCKVPKKYIRKNPDEEYDLGFDYTNIVLFLRRKRWGCEFKGTVSAKGNLKYKKIQMLIVVHNQYNEPIYVNTELGFVESETKKENVININISLPDCEDKVSDFYFKFIPDPTLF